METSLNNNEVRQKRKSIGLWVLVIFIIGYVFFIVNFYFFKAPQESKITIIHISPSQTINSLAKDLEDRKVIKYSQILEFMLKITNRDNKISVGDYKFDKNSSIWKVFWQISTNRHNIEPLKITLREGLTNEEMAKIFAEKISVFRRDLFLTSAKAKQGYLFPDTYFFYSLTTTEEILNELSLNFENKIKTIDSLIKKNGKPLSEIIIMASLIEKEASNQEDAGMISGILWKRIELGMPLQADASPITYKQKGLPENPICNPGLSSIKAALEPVASSYLYYLHDKDGNVYYAKTYTEHKQNISKYLK